MRRTFRPHSAQACASDTGSQGTQERTRESSGSQHYASPTQPTPTPPPPYASTNLLVPSQHELLVSGLDQDEFSRPLLPPSHLAASDRSDGFTNRSLIQSQAPYSDDFRGRQLGKGFRHFPDHSESSQNFGQRRTAHETDQIRPTTAPVIMSERLAPDTISLSQMLPPDRILPFPEKQDMLPSSTPKPPASSQEQPESSSTTSDMVMPNRRESVLAKAKTSTKTNKEPTATTLIRATTPYNLRPGSSSSNAGLLKSAAFNPTFSADAAKAPARERVAASRERLAREGWALSEADFLRHFNEESFSNSAFLDELVKFAKIQKSFAAAKPLLLAAQKARQNRTVPGHKFREWISSDVKNAMSAQKGSKQGKHVANNTSRKANTPKKRIRTASPIPQEVRQGGQKLAQALTTGENTESTLLAPICSPTLPFPTRKRPAAALGESSDDAETESGNSGLVSTPTIETQATSAALDTQTRPTNTQADLAIPSELQATSATPDLPVSPMHTGGVPAAATDNLTIATTKKPIQPTEMISVLDEWAKTSKLFPVRTILFQDSKDLLAEYAAQDDASRVRSLDDMICECLEDPNFIKLAQDVEGAWARVGLGF